MIARSENSLLAGACQVLLPCCTVAAVAGQLAQVETANARAYSLAHGRRLT